MTIARDALPHLVLPTEVVQVEPLGGEVIVRGLDLPGLLRYEDTRRQLQVPRSGETPEQAIERANTDMVPHLLAVTVVLDDGLPVYSPAEWRVFGARHVVEALDLYRVAVRLSGQDPAAEKKT